MAVLQERPSLIEVTPIDESLPPLDIFTPPIEKTNIDEVILLKHQIRDKKHGRFDELKDSIEKIGVDNPPNMAVGTGELFTEYLDYQNRRRGTSYHISQFQNQRVGEDTYKFVFAGHNRTKAGKDQAKQYREQIGGHALVTMPFKRYDNPTLEQILYIQFAENIHEGIRTETEAQYVLDYYTWGIENNRWSNADQFRELQDGKIDMHMMNQVLAFYDLPEKVQNDVFEKKIPYRAGVILGQMIPLVRQMFRFEANVPFGPMTEEVAGAHDEYANIVAADASIHIQNNRGMRRNPIAAGKHLASLRGPMERALGGPVATSVDVGFDEITEDDFALATVDEQALIQVQQKKRELAATMKAASEEPHLAAAEMLLRYGSMVDKMGDKLCDELVSANTLLAEDVTKKRDRQEEAEVASLFDDLGEFEQQFAVA